MRRFLANDIPAVGEFLTLDSAGSHHVLRVTGIAPGEVVELFDGAGGSCRAELISVEDGEARLRVVEHLDPVAVERRIVLILSQLRASAMDGVLRMATELGVSHIQVIQTERCVAQGDKRERWNRIVTAAAGQCGRSDVPFVPTPIDFESALSEGAGERFICVPGADVVETPSGDVSLLVGPEGGFTADEVSQAEASGWVAAGLGRTVLRADTAAVSAIVRYGG